MQTRWYTCENELEPDGPETCCIVADRALYAMPQPDDGDLRCKPHGALLGTRLPLVARSEQHARDKLRGL